MVVLVHTDLALGIDEHRLKTALESLEVIDHKELFIEILQP